MDYLDELIEEHKKNPEFARAWSAVEIMHELLAARVKAGLSQEQVAARMGIARPRVAELEKKPGSASFERVLSYAAAVGANVIVDPTTAKCKTDVGRAPAKASGRGRPVGSKHAAKGKSANL